MTRIQVSIVGDHELLPALVKYYVETKKATVDQEIERDVYSEGEVDLAILGIGNQSLTRMVSEVEGLMKRSIPIIALVSSDIYPCAREIPNKSKHGMSPEDDIVLKPGQTHPIKYLAAESLLLKHKYPIVILRTFDVYGPEVQSTVAHWISLAARKIPLPVIDDGEQKRTFLYIDDFLEAIDLLQVKLLEGASGIYNIGATEAISYKRLGYYVWSMLYGEEEGLSFNHLPSFETHTWKVPNIQKLQDFIPWAPKVSLRRGLFNLLSHLQKSKA